MPKLESIKELRQICQKGKVRARGILYYAFCRMFSIHITRLLLPTGISPNQVTLAGLLMGIAGVALLFNKSLEMTIAGLALIYGWLLSDKVDGEIARYKNQHSVKGIYMDQIAHMAIVPAFFFAAAYRTYAETGLIFVWFAGFAAALFPLLTRFEYKIPYQLFAQRIIRNSDLFCAVKNTLSEKQFAGLKESAWQESRSKGFYAARRIAELLSDEFLKILLLFAAFAADYFVSPLYGFASMKLIVLCFFGVTHFLLLAANVFSAFFGKRIDKKTAYIYNVCKEAMKQK